MSTSILGFGFNSNNPPNSYIMRKISKYIKTLSIIMMLCTAKDAKSQGSIPFSWDINPQNKNLIIQGDEIKVINTQTKKTEFEGFKDWRITINQPFYGRPTLHQIDIKVFGFIDNREGKVEKFEYKENQSVEFNSVYYVLSFDNQTSGIALLFINPNSLGEHSDIEVFYTQKNVTRRVSLKGKLKIRQE